MPAPRCGRTPSGYMSRRMYEVFASGSLRALTSAQRVHKSVGVVKRNGGPNRMKRPRFLLPILLSCVLVIGNPAIFSSFANAWSRGFGSSRSFSFSRGSSHWSSSTRSTWNRNGGGLLRGGTRSLGGYSKPRLERTSPSSGYSKPNFKESLPSRPSGTFRETRPSSSGYTKPGMKESTRSGRAQPGEFRSSGGYAKPTTGTGKPQTFSGGSKFDKQAIAQEQKKRSQASLKQYQAEQAKFKNPAPKIDPKQYESNPLYQKGKVYLRIRLPRLLRKP